MVDTCLKVIKWMLFRFAAENYNEVIYLTSQLGNKISIKMERNQNYSEGYNETSYIQK